MYYDLSTYDWSVHTILIAEDDVSSTFYLKEVLKDTQADILHAMDGAEAVELCKKHPEIDLILMDIKMPRMNGIEAARAIRLFNPNVPIIAQTANAYHETRIHCEAAGCNGFISKPVDSVELLELINGFLILRSKTS